MSELALDFCPGGLALNDGRGYVPSQRADFFPEGVMRCPGQVELLPQLAQIGLGTLRSCRFVVGADERAPYAVVEVDDDFFD